MNHPPPPDDEMRLRHAESVTRSIIGRFSSAKVDVYVKLSPYEVEIVRAALEATLPENTNT